jgi:hypothetical protein
VTGRSTSVRLAIIVAAVGVVSAVALGLAVRQWAPRAEAHIPHSGIDFSVAIPTAGCDSSSGTASCDVAGPFTLQLRLNTIPGGFTYGAYDSEIQLSGVTATESSLVQQGAGVWPSCTYAASNFTPAQVNVSCARGVETSASSYTGALWTLELACDGEPSSATITLVHGEAHTAAVDSLLVPHGEAGTELLTLQCGDVTTPTPTATPPAASDTDGDGCPDANEQQTAPGSETSGGLRDHLNPHDYMNPTGDGENRIDDVLMVIQQYFDDAFLDPPDNSVPNPAYNPDTDRTAIGPDAWDLGPPNGEQRIDDILAIIFQYLHDCP